jgi:hypothetical protein
VSPLIHHVSISAQPPKPPHSNAVIGRRSDRNLAVIPVNAGCLETRDVSARLADARTLRITVTVAQCRVGLGGGGTQRQPAQVLYGIPLSGLPRGGHLDVDVEVAGIPGTGPKPEDVGTAGIDMP